MFVVPLADRQQLQQERQLMRRHGEREVRCQVPGILRAHVQKRRDGDMCEASQAVAKPEQAKAPSVGACHIYSA